MKLEGNIVQQIATIKALTSANKEYQEEILALNNENNKITNLAADFENKIQDDNSQFEETIEGLKSANYSLVQEN